MDLLHWLWSAPCLPCLPLRLLGHQVHTNHVVWVTSHITQSETLVPLCSASMFAVSFPLFVISATSAKPTPSRYITYGRALVQRTECHGFESHLGQLFLCPILCSLICTNNHLVPLDGLIHAIILHGGNRANNELFFHRLPPLPIFNLVINVTNKLATRTSPRERGGTRVTQHGTRYQEPVWQHYMYEMYRSTPKSSKRVDH